MVSLPEESLAELQSASAIVAEKLLAVASVAGMILRVRVRG
jgi:hypothetical protein